MARILIIDDNQTIREGLSAIVRKMGHDAAAHASGDAALAGWKSAPADFVITDLKMEGMDGVAVLRALRELDPDVPAMIITAFGTVETAVEAMKLGAFDFLTKPFAPEVARLKIERALELRATRRAHARAERENEYRRDEESARYGDLVGASPPMQAIFALLSKVAPTESSVFVFGESGTGKELVARAIHQRSRRAQGPFIKVSCGALSETLLESELFGHEKGAFTGAIKRKLGRFELADGGTLFLDEIGDVSPAVQLKLLRVLQERELERVGGEATLRVDVRVISATNKNLEQEVAAGRFREDLYYRLHIVPLTLPPLRERPGDIEALARHFLPKLRTRTNPRIRDIADETMALLRRHRWPGNVRELENVIEQALVFAEGEILAPAALPASLLGEGSARGGLQLPPGEMALPDLLEDLERQLIEKAYERANGVKTETARLLGIKTSALYYKLEKYGIGGREPSEN
jgi:two-component system response regulator HydG